MGLGALLMDSDRAEKRLKGEPMPVSPPYESPPEFSPRARSSSPGARANHATTRTRSVNTPPASSISSAAPPSETSPAAFSMLYPALGCPALVGEDNTLEIMMVCRAAKDDITVETIRNHLKEVMVMEWAQARAPYIHNDQPWQTSSLTLESLLAGPIIIQRKKTLDEYREAGKERHVRFGSSSFFHTIADVIPRVYILKGFQSVVSIRLRLTVGNNLARGTMYSLYYPPENGLVREILDETGEARFGITEYVLQRLEHQRVPNDVRSELAQLTGQVFNDETDFLSAIEDQLENLPDDGEEEMRRFRHLFIEEGNLRLLKLPYDDVPLMQVNGRATAGGPDLLFRHRGTNRQLDPNRQHLVRLFHPFLMVDNSKRNYLDVGHITDMHTSTLWDYIDDKIYNKLTSVRQPLQFQPNGNLPNRSPDSTFADIATRYNNPNINLRNLTFLLNQPDKADIILQTGDLIDFNRGYNYDDDHRIDEDYELNLNWIRYFELLLLDYEKPTYTALGNHDLHVNPYPPVIIVEFVHVVLVMFIVIASCAGTGGIWELLHAKDAHLAWRLILSMLMFLFMVFLLLFIVLAAGFDADFAVDFLIAGLDQAGWHNLWIIPLIMLLGLGFTGLLEGFSSLGAGYRWLAYLGIALGASMFLFLLFLLDVSYMGGITNMKEEDFGELLNNESFLRAFNKDGLWNTTELAYDWYSLTINPFPDYAFKHGNMSVMMGSWEGSSVFPYDPPLADDAFTNRQWGLVEAWLEEVIRMRNKSGDNSVIPIIGLHTPVFCPQLEDNLDTLRSDGTETDAGNLRRGIMEERRMDFISKANELGSGENEELDDNKKVPVISLTGHTHVYDIFVMEPSGDRVKWYQTADLPWDKDHIGLHITTASAGPPTDGASVDQNDDIIGHFRTALQNLEQAKDNTYQPGFSFESDGLFGGMVTGKRALRPSGCRILKINPTNGRIERIMEVSAKTAKYKGNDEEIPPAAEPNPSLTTS